MKRQTRCRECLFAGNKLNQVPCNKCTEIQRKIRKNDNYFTPASYKESEDNE